MLLCSKNLTLEVKLVHQRARLSRPSRYLMLKLSYSQIGQVLNQHMNCSIEGLEMASLLTSSTKKQMVKEQLSPLLNQSKIKYLVVLPQFLGDPNQSSCRMIRPSCSPSLRGQFIDLTRISSSQLSTTRVCCLPSVEICRYIVTATPITQRASLCQAAHTASHQAWFREVQKPTTIQQGHKTSE